ncbi:MAG: glycogen debranching enzyme family protein [Phycisphaeraceae bacterium]|nr:glycogen debranching enzyme family protein [Phycisphaeraceae bacterium]
MPLPTLKLELSNSGDVPGYSGLAAPLRREWFLANGLGGFASGTSLAIPQRRYHAWLIGAMQPPVGRVVGLNSMVETVVLRHAEPARGEKSAATSGAGGDQRVDFSSFMFPGNSEPARMGEAGGPPVVINPCGHSYLRRFEKDVSCRWFYQCGPVDFTRELTLVRNQNVAVLRYRVKSARHAAKLELRPLTALRDFHELVRYSDRKNDYSVLAGTSSCDVSSRGNRLTIEASQGSFVQDRNWWFNFRYERDAERGQDCLEDLFTPGWFSWNVEPGLEQSLELVARVAPVTTRPTRVAIGFDAAAGAERGRLTELAAAARPGAVKVAPADADAIAVLVQSADQFVVRRVRSVGAGARAMAGVAPSEAALADESSVIAGYPWFSDWGRDTMISLPGLFLTTGRFDEARRVMETFANLTRRGLVPNCFDNGSGDAEYNTVDASLWFLHAARALQLACEKGKLPDPAPENSPIRRACLAILDAYQTGTDFSIRMDPKDGLITAGDVGTQLTWMDAKRDGVVFTPRHGKPVEINALWYSGLLQVADMIEKDRPKTSRELRQIAERAGKSFREQFWNPAGYLFDVLTPSAGVYAPNQQIRPNQIFACSLPYSPLDTSQRDSVLAVVRQHLLTDRGLRTLSPHDPHYIGRFEGPLFERDRAYHNGTVWPWLLGPFAEAILRCGGFSASSKAEARRVIQPLFEMVAPAAGGGPALGQIPEIYDGDDSPDRPRRPDGCFAQAWSVAECLRVWLLTSQ